MTADRQLNTQAEAVATLLDLELRLMDPKVRRDRDQVSALLADEFREFGSSGKIWSKAEILNLLAHEPSIAPPVVEDFTVREISTEAMLVTYKTVNTRAADDSEGRLLCAARCGLLAKENGSCSFIKERGGRALQLPFSAETGCNCVSRP